MYATIVGLLRASTTAICRKQFFYNFNTRSFVHIGLQGLYTCLMPYRRHHTPAFTLIELLVVIAIIGILITLVVTQLGNSRRRARNAQAQSDISEMGKAVESFRNDDAASDGVVSNISNSVDSLKGTVWTPGSPPFSGSQNVSSLTYGVSVLKTPSSAYTYRYVTQPSATAGRSLVSGPAGQGAYSLCTTIVGETYPYYCASDTGGGQNSLTQANQSASLSGLTPAAANGLIAWYKLDSSGTSITAIDSSASGNDGKLINFTFDGTNGWRKGMFNNAMYSNSAQWVVIPNTSAFNLRSFTVSVWMKAPLAGQTNAYPHIFNYADTSTGIYLSGFAGTSQLEGRIDTATAYNQNFHCGNVFDNNWHHIVLSSDQTTNTSIFIDGMFGCSGNNALPGIAVSSNPAYLGTDHNQHYPLKGDLDDFRFYNRALSLSEVQQLFAGTL